MTYPTISKRSILLLCSCILSVTTNAQLKSQSKVMYVIDSVPVNSELQHSLFLNEELNDLDDNDIYSINIMTNTDSIAALDYDNIKGIDSVFFINTKEYMRRSDSIKKILSAYYLSKRNNKSYIKGTNKLYTGPCIIYYYSGKVCLKLKLIKGKIEDTSYMFYKDGITLKLREIYKGGDVNGLHTEYFPNGQIKSSGNIVNNKREGNWNEWYSTGKLKRKWAYNDDIMTIPVQDKSFWQQYEDGLTANSNQNYKKAIQLFDVAIERRSDFYDLYLNKGEAELHLSMYDDAIKDFDKVTELEPYDFKAVIQRVKARLRKCKLIDDPNLKSHKNNEGTSAQNSNLLTEEEKNKICADLRTIHNMQKAGADATISTALYGFFQQAILKDIEIFCQ